MVRMRTYWMIGAGGFLGSILRYLIRELQIQLPSGIPVCTLAINLSGSFLLALIMTLSAERLKLDADVRLGITTGFVGAFTTFSTLCKETDVLIEAGAAVSAVVYVAVSVLFGLLFACLGASIAKKANLKLREINGETSGKE